MSDKVVELPVVTRLPIPVERVLRGASEANLSEVVVVGYDEDGELYFASSDGDGGGVLWLFALASKRLMELADE